MKTTEQIKQELKQEMITLEEKRDKLENFIQLNKEYKNLSLLHQDLLHLQLNTMNNYHYILQMRINNLKGE